MKLIHYSTTYHQSLPFNFVVVASCWPFFFIFFLFYLTRCYLYLSIINDFYGWMMDFLLFDGLIDVDESATTSNLTCLHDICALFHLHRKRKEYWICFSWVSQIQFAITTSLDRFVFRYNMTFTLDNALLRPLMSLIFD